MTIMSVIGAVVAFIRGNLSYDAIIGDFNKAAKRLSDFHEQQTAKAQEQADVASDAQSKARSHLAAAERAARTRSKIVDLVS